jgi:hypothetical protein
MKQLVSCRPTAAAHLKSIGNVDRHGGVTHRIQWLQGFDDFRAQQNKFSDRAFSA